MGSQSRKLKRFRRALVLANVGGFVVLLATVVFALVESHEALTLRGQETAANLARTIGLNVSAEFKQIDNALLTVAFQVKRSDHTGVDEQHAVARIVDEQRMLVPQVDYIRLTDAQGTVLNAGAQNALSVGDRDYFQAARSLPPQLVISEPLQGRITKRWGIVLARARTDDEGGFVGVAYSNLYSDRLVSVFDDVALGAHGAVTLRTASLHLVARHSPGATEPNLGVGTSNVSAEFRRALDSNAERGTFKSRAVVDGIERINAFQRVPGYPLVLLVGLATDEFYVPWRKEAVEMGALALALEVGLVWLSAWIYRQQRQQARSHDEIARLAAEGTAMLDNELVGMAKLRGTHEVWHNPALATLFGYRPGELTGAPARLLYADDESYARTLRDFLALSEREHLRTQLRMVRKDGRQLWIDVSSAKLPGGESLWFLLDISRAKASEEEARHQSRHDALTGLPNRVVLRDELRDRLAALASQEHVAVCYIDLDGFKAVNDEHGHQAGDRLLKVAAQRMQGVLRQGDMIARLGGDKFVAVLCRLRETAEAVAVVQRLLDELVAPIAVRDGAHAVVSASIGVVWCGDAQGSVDGLLQRADEQMYEAKRQGKNRFSLRVEDAGDGASGSPGTTRRS